MPYLNRVWFLVAVVAIGCGTPQATSNPRLAPVASQDGIPAPAVSHALDMATSETPSAAAHHSDPPSDGPSVDPVKAAPAVAPTGAAPATLVRELTVPAGTSLTVHLATAVSSDGGTVKHPVQGTLRRAVVVNGATVIPAGAAVAGEATTSGRVQGRASVGVRFSTVSVGGARYTIRTSTGSRGTGSTNKAVGAASDVLATGGEVALSRDSVVTVRLSEPVTIRIH